MLFRSFTARLAALYTAAFAVSVAVLGAATLLATRAAMARQFDARITAEASALAQEFRTEGAVGVVQAVKERDRTPGALAFGLAGPRGVPLAGRLPAAHAPLGWWRLNAGGEGDSLRVLTVDLPQGYRLSVGDDEERSDALQGAVLTGFAWALAGVLVIGGLAGWGLGRGVHRRLAAMTGAAEAIIDGDLARRIPLRGSDDDLDRLAASFNRMLDRIGALMDSLRQVSNDIAHDLRTPLTRLRQRLEASRELTGAERADASDAALAEVDAILDAFAALLRIAQVEAGARRAAFQRLDLAEAARQVADAFAPSAEDVGQSITFLGEEALPIDGDRDLLTQMLANLVENALRHAGPKARVEVSVRRDGDEAVLSVTDDGPGVPATERERVFERFFRLERSRTTEGSGLGLALVSAVARLHGARIELADAGPGLMARITFPARR